jgi:anaerobic C4-dicarboxylate transporter
VVLIGMFPNLRPAYQIVSDGGVDTDQVSMGMAIMIVMLTIAGLTTLLFKASPNVMLKGTIMQSGVSAVISILGVAWLGSSFFEGNRGAIVAGISRLVDSHPWAFGVGLFILSSLLFSAAATVAILIPVGLAVGLPPYLLVAFYPAANSVFFFPTYGTVLAAVSFDQTGTTKIGKLLLNHSFMLPGLVTVFASVVIALCLGRLFLHG